MTADKTPSEPGTEPEQSRDAEPSDSGAQHKASPAPKPEPKPTAAPAPRPAPQQASSAPAPAAVAPARGGGAGLWLALLDLIAIVALGAGGYLALQGFENQRHSQQQRVDGIDQRVNQLEVNRQGREQWFADIEERSRAAQRELVELQRARRDGETRNAKIEESLSQLSRQVQGGQQTWQRTEVEHLLLVANTRLQLERDLDGAATALRLADQRLAQMANPAYFAVRERIARELAQIDAVPRLDVQALALNLASLAEQVDALAIRTPRVGVFATELSLESASLDLPWHQKLWAALRETIDGLVTVRRDVDRRDALLSPDQSIFLRLNLRLQLESARVAALKGDAANLDTALNQAETWLRRYFDASQTPTAAALSTLKDLRELKLSPPLPDISGSLNALRNAEPEA